MTKNKQGVLNTGANRAQEAEAFASRVQAIPSRRPLALITDPTRFVGDLSRQTLFNATVPNSHPTRNRRLTETLQVYGVTVWAEGTEGEVVNVNEFDTGGIDVTGFPSHLRLVLLRGAIKLGSYRITSMTGTSIFTEEEMDFAVTVWQLVEETPMQALPVPSDQAMPGTEVTYLIVKPPRWPLLRNNQFTLAQSPALSGGITMDAITGRLTLNGSHNQPSQIYQVDDVVNVSLNINLKGIMARVQDVVFTPGLPNTEVLTLEPLFNEAVPIYTSPSNAAYKVAQVRDVLANPYAPVNGVNIWNNKDVLESMRLYPLVAPVNGDPSRIPFGVHSLFSNNAAPYVPPTAAGFRVVLYPATVAGTADLTRPITDFNDIIIDPMVTEPQSVEIDYAQGAILLSHAIPAAGGDLNPNGYVSPSGTRHLFVACAAYNSSYAPETVEGLRTSAERSLTYEIGPLNRDLINLARGWTFRDQSFDPYHEQQGQSQRPTKPAVMIAAGSGGSASVVVEGNPQIFFQTKSTRTPSTAIGALGYGPVLNLTDTQQQISILPSAQGGGLVDLSAGSETAITSEGHSYITFSEGWKDLVINANVTITAGVNDQIRWHMNDVAMVLTLSPGFKTAAALQTELASLIVAAGVSAGVPQIVVPTSPNQNINLQPTPDKTGLRVSVRDYFVTGTGSSHATLGIPNHVRVLPVGLFQKIVAGSDQTSPMAWDYQHRENKRSAQWRGEDVKILGGSSLRAVGEAFEVGHTNYVVRADDTPITFNANDVKIPPMDLFVTRNEDNQTGVRLVQVPDTTVSISGPSAVYLIYWDEILESLEFVDYALVLDKTLRTPPYRGVGVALVSYNFITNINFVIDIRPFLTNQKQNDTITVGTGGMFRTLQGAMAWIEAHPQGSRHVKLISDVEHVGPTAIPIPSNVTLDGQGYTVTVSGYDTVFGDLFHLDHDSTFSAESYVKMCHFKVVFAAPQVQFSTFFINKPGAQLEPSTLVLEDILIVGHPLRSFGFLVGSDSASDLKIHATRFVTQGLRFALGFIGKEVHLNHCKFLDLAPIADGRLIDVRDGSKISIHNTLALLNASLGGQSISILSSATSSTTTNDVDIEICHSRFSVGDIDAIRLTMISPTVPSRLSIRHTEILVDEASNHFIADGSGIGDALRAIDIDLDHCDLLRTKRAYPPSAGIQTGSLFTTTIPVKLSLDTCRLDHVYISGSSNSGHTFLIQNCSTVFNEGSAVEILGTGGGKVILKDNRWDNGYFGFSECDVTIEGGVYRSFGFIQSPTSVGSGFFAFFRCTVNAGSGLQIVKTSPDNISCMSFFQTCSLQADQVSIRHGGALDQSLLGIVAESNAIFDRFQVNNLKSIFTGPPPTNPVNASAIVFLPRVALARASCVMTNFIVENYPTLTVAPDPDIRSNAVRVSSNWEIVNITSGLVLTNTTIPVKFNFAATVNIFVDATVRFITL
jgi:hypothetical protein